MSWVTSRDRFQDCSVTVWAMAHLAYVNSPFLLHLVEQVLAQIHRFGSQESVNCSNFWLVSILAVWSVWVLYFCTWVAPTEDRLRDKLSKSIDFGKSQDISNSAWASARLLIRDSRLWTALSAAAQEAMPHFAPQKISNTAWGFSTIEVRVVKHDKNASSCKHFLMDYMMDHYGLVWKSGIHISTCMLPLMIFCITLLNYDFPHTFHSLCFLEKNLRDRTNRSVSLGCFHFRYCKERLSKTVLQNVWTNAFLICS